MDQLATSVTGLNLAMHRTTTGETMTEAGDLTTTGRTTVKAGDQAMPPNPGPMFTRAGTTPTTCVLKTTRIDTEIPSEVLYRGRKVDTTTPTNIQTDAGLESERRTTTRIDAGTTSERLNKYPTAETTAPTSTPTDAGNANECPSKGGTAESGVPSKRFITKSESPNITVRENLDKTQVAGPQLTPHDPRTTSATLGSASKSGKHREASSQHLGQEGRKTFNLAYRPRAQPATVTDTTSATEHNNRRNRRSRPKSAASDKVSQIPPTSSTVTEGSSKPSRPQTVSINPAYRARNPLSIPSWRQAASTSSQTSSTHISMLRLSFSLLFSLHPSLSFSLSSSLHSSLHSSLPFSLARMGG